MNYEIPQQKSPINSMMEKIQMYRSKHLHNATSNKFMRAIYIYIIVGSLIRKYFIEIICSMEIFKYCLNLGIFLNKSIMQGTLGHVKI